MRVLLSSAFFSETLGYTPVNGGLLYLIEPLKREGIEVFLYTEPISHCDFDSISGIIFEFGIDIVLFSIYEDNFFCIKDFVEFLKKRFPYLKIIVGGPMPTLFPYVVFDNMKSVDLVFLGEGEEIIVDILRYVFKGNDIPKAFSGFIYRREDGRIIDRSGFINRVDPDKNFISYGTYKDFYLSNLKEDTVSLMLHTARGCLYRCKFCSHQYGGKARVVSSEKIVDFLLNLREDKERLSIPSRIDFTDDDFFVDRERAIEFFRFVNEYGFFRDLMFYFQASCRTFLRPTGSGLVPDLELIEAMNPNREIFIVLNFGIDGGTDRELKRLGKPFYRMKDVERLFDELVKRKIIVVGNFILSNLYTTLEDLFKTLFFIFVNTIKFKGFFRHVNNVFLIPHYGTRIYWEYIKGGYKENILVDKVIGKDRGYYEFNNIVIPKDELVYEILKKYRKFLGRSYSASLGNFSQEKYLIIQSIYIKIMREIFELARKYRKNDYENIVNFLNRSLPKRFLKYITL